MQINVIDMVKKVVVNLDHCKLLGIELVTAETGKLALRLPYSEKIVGNLETGVIHGGALTTLMDTTCGFSAICMLNEFAIAPTLDLRIDYMGAAEPGKAIIGEAEVYRMTSNVIFTRGKAYHEGSEDRPIAHCTATFMRMELPPERVESIVAMFKEKFS